MGVLRMVVIAGTIQVAGHYRNVVRAILTVIELTHLKDSVLGYGIGFVGFFPKGPLTDSPRGSAGDDAEINTPVVHEQKFLHLVLIRAGDHVRLNSQIDIHELRWGHLICVDPPYLHGCQKHILWFFFIKKGLHILLTCQVQLGMASCYDVLISFLFSFLTITDPTRPL